MWLPDGASLAYTAGPERNLFIRRPDGTVVPLTHEPGYLRDTQARYFAMSADGGTAAFVTGQSLELIDVNTRTLSRVAAADDSRLAFSPNGREVAYTLGDLHVFDRLDRSTHVVAAAGTDPAWSPNGTLAFDRAGFVYLLEHGIERLIASGTRPVWSGDGNWIAYERDGFLFALRLSGGDEVRLDRGQSPQWLATGTKIVYGGVLGDLREVDATGGEPRVIYDSVQVDHDPVPSPDGSRLAFIADRITAANPHGQTGYGDIYVVGRDGGGRQAVVEGCGIDPSLPPTAACLLSAGISLPLALAHDVHLTLRLLGTGRANDHKRTTWISGHVLDGAGHSVRDAVVRVQTPTRAATSRVLFNGFWHFEVRQPRRYESVVVRFSVNTPDGLVTKTVTLRDGLFG